MDIWLIWHHMMILNNKRTASTDQLDQKKQQLRHVKTTVVLSHPYVLKSGPLVPFSSRGPLLFVNLKFVKYKSKFLRELNGSGTVNLRKIRDGSVACTLEEQRENLKASHTAESLGALSRLAILPQCSFPDLLAEVPFPLLDPDRVLPGKKQSWETLPRAKPIWTGTLPSRLRTILYSGTVPKPSGTVPEPFWSKKTNSKAKKQPKGSTNPRNKKHFTATLYHAGAVQMTVHIFCEGPWRIFFNNTALSVDCQGHNPKCLPLWEVRTNLCDEVDHVCWGFFTAYLCLYAVLMYTPSPLVGRSEICIRD